MTDFAFQGNDVQLCTTDMNCSSTLIPVHSVLSILKLSESCKYATACVPQRRVRVCVSAGVHLVSVECSQQSPSVHCLLDIFAFVLYCSLSQGNMISQAVNHCPSRC